MKQTVMYALSLLLAAAAPAFGAVPLAEKAVLTASDPTANAHLGLGVALSRDGRIALAGASQASCSAGSSCGAVYAYFGSGSSWSSQGKLTAADGAPGDGFGKAIALSADGSLALIGAPDKGCTAGVQCGAVYVFTRSGSVWSQVAELTASDAAAGDGFGFSIALSASGLEALIGAPTASCIAGSFCGKVYVFEGSGAFWTQDVQLTPLDLTSAGNFGQSVALSADGTTALIGKPGDSCGLGFGCGAAYLYMGSGASWIQVSKLAPSDPQDHSDFGWSVALSQDGAYGLVGRPFFDCGAGQDCGTAHVFTRASTWSEVARLAPTPANAFGEFGFSVALTDDAGTALLGSPGATCAAGACGAAFVFSNLGGIWSQSQELLASTPVDSSALGISVALANDAATALAGANFDPCPAPATGAACGAVHVFAAAPIIAVPALGPLGLALLALLLAAAGIRGTRLASLQHDTLGQRGALPRLRRGP